MARLLVVDDDPAILKIADQVLTHAGHQVFMAGDAMRAIDMLGSGGFDLLISDANMPMYSGFDLIKTVRANPLCKDMAIAMLTGLRERKDVEKAVKAGADDYIVKPLDPLLLIQKVTSLLEKHQPTEKPEISFNPHTESAHATLAFSVALVSISELGVVIRTNLPLKTGQTYDLSAAFFDQLGDKVPPLRVLQATPTGVGDEFEIQMAFLGAHESLLQKIRRWIFSHGSSHRRTG